MKAVIIREYGQNEVVEIAEIDMPEPGPSEVRVRIEAAGVNPIDWKIREGAGQRMGVSLPIVLGGEIVGVVDKLGADVTGLAVGDKIWGVTTVGGFADYAVTKATSIARRPATLDAAHAAAVPLGALTAWQAIEAAGLAAGQRIFITNGSGAVGSMAVQLAKAKGAHVTAMASGANAAFVRGLGADAFIDHNTQMFDTIVRNMDVVLDTVGGDVFERSLTTVKPGGFLVTVVAFPDDACRQHGFRVERVQCTANTAQLSAICDMVEAGGLKARVATVLPLDRVHDALDLSKNGRAGGKIVLSIAA